MNVAQLSPTIGSSSPDIERQSRIEVTVRWSFVIVMVAVGLVLHRVLAPMGPPSPSPYHLPWWVLGAAFGAVGMVAIHLPTDEGEHTLTLTEVVLVFGLALAGPSALITGRLIGSGIVLAARRRPPLGWAIFYMTLAYLEATVAVLLYRWLLQSGSPIGIVGWFSAITAIVATTSLEWWLAEANRPPRRRTREETRQAFVLDTLLSAGTALVGIGFLLMAWRTPWGLALVLALGAMLHFAISAFGRLSKKHLDLEAVFAFSREIQRPLHTEEIVTTTLEQVRKHMRAETAEMLVFSPNPDEPCHLVSLGVDETLHFRSVRPSMAVDLHRMVLAHPDERWFTTSGGSAWLRGHYERQGLSSGLISPVRTNDGIVAMLVAGNRRPPLGPFSQEDLPLLDLLARQTSDTLARSELLERVEREASEREAQAADMVRAKDEFIASVSHELRTPLTAVFGSAQLLQEGLDLMEHGERLELIEYISRESGELANLVEDLLVNARADVGTLTIKPETIELAQEARKCIEAIRNSIEGANVDADDIHGTAYADPLRFRQVMRNLLTNAVRYGGDRIWIRTERRRGWVFVLVCDDGPGIPLAQRDTIFMPYQRAHTASGVTGSVGLGLSVARQLSELMDGHLVYRYVDGVSVFELQLPETESAGATPRHRSDMIPDRGLFAPRRDAGLPVA